MVPSKLLIGSVVGVGSVSTVAVVAHQQGFFSTSNNQTQSSNNTTNTDTSRAPEAQTLDGDTTSEQPKPNQEEVKQWLTDNKKEGEDWKIQIKKNGEPKEFENPLIKEDDLSGLKDYLDSDERKELLKDLFSALDTKTLTFEKTNGNWKHILTKENVEKWVSKTSGSRATLKVADGNTEKERFSEDESIAIFKAVYDKKSMFTSLKEGSDNKTILFEKIDNNWKHSKTEIATWLSTDGENKFTVQIKTTTGNTDLNNEKEENLIGLLGYLKTAKTKETLFKFVEGSGSNSLTFEREENNWDVVYDETIINNWIGKTSAHMSLKFWDNGTEKELNQIPSELKQLFKALKEDEEKFTSINSSTTIVFEKDGGSWKRIKTALTDLLTKTKKKTGLTIKISKSGTPTELSDVNDDELIGLYKYISDSTDLEATKDVGFLVFKKDGSTWSRDKAQEKN